MRSANPDSVANLRLSELVRENPGPPLTHPPGIAVLDLFAGIGGFSSGFHAEGFCVTGVDSEPVAVQAYRDAGFGEAFQADLGTTLFGSSSPVVIGGPPCRPWSPVNQQRRRAEHADHGLLARFADHVREVRPLVFVMENVPALKADDIYGDSIRALTALGFDIEARILHYDQFGAATRRRRLFTVGVRGRLGGAHAVFHELRQEHKPQRTVRDAISAYRNLARDAVPDHDWSELTTIGKYRDRYETGQYGWRKLDYDSPAPSFGSVAKTYILHPEAGEEGYPERVLSVREVMAIMGFPETVVFPKGTPRAKRYQMAANAVSPQVSRAIATAVKRFLTGGVRDAIQRNFESPKPALAGE